MTNLEKLLTLLVCLLVSILLIGFGTLIGATSFKNSLTGFAWTEVLTTLSAIFAMFATSIGAFCAWQALTIWKKESHWKEVRVGLRLLEETFTSYYRVCRSSNEAESVKDKYKRVFRAKCECYGVLNSSVLVSLELKYFRELLSKLDQLSCSILNLEHTIDSEAYSSVLDELDECFSNARRDLSDALKI